MIKTVSFKDIKEEKMINFLNENGYLNNFSYYVKDLIKKDMQGAEPKVTEEESIITKEDTRKKRNTNFYME